MPYLLLRYKVEDYHRWRSVFGQQAGQRRASGSKGARLFRNDDDPGEVFLLFEWDDMENARCFVCSEEFEQQAEEAGLGRPDIRLLQEVEHITS